MRERYPLRAQVDDSVHLLATDPCRRSRCILHCTAPPVSATFARGAAHRLRECWKRRQGRQRPRSRARRSATHRSRPDWRRAVTTAVTRRSHRPVGGRARPSSAPSCAATIWAVRSSSCSLNVACRPSAFDGAIECLGGAIDSLGTAVDGLAVADGLGVADCAAELSCAGSRLQHATGRCPTCPQRLQRVVACGHAAFRWPTPPHASTAEGSPWQTAWPAASPSRCMPPTPLHPTRRQLHRCRCRCGGAAALWWQSRARLQLLLPRRPRHLRCAP